jgi:two-component system sensor histidine kinase and response regulator WspE
MIRNAVDHGIETPEARRAAGKPERGTIRIEARHWAGRLSVRISDDGRGVDPDAVRARVVSRGLADEAAAAALSHAELLEFLFRPGFSTADHVTDISGRGVGLDVVQEMVHSVAGTLRLHSEKGAGATLHLQVPLTLSVVRVVMVAIGGDAYAVPLRRVQRVLSLRSSEIRTLENRPFFAVGDEQVSLVGAREVLELEGGAALPDPLCVVVIGEGKEACGVAVDRFLGEIDVVVRPLDRRLGKVRDVFAVTTTATGEPMLILDVDDLLQSIQRMATGGRTDKLRVGDAGTPDVRKRILVVDDSLTVRETERQLLVNRGYDVTTANDGMDAWDVVQAQVFDLVITDVDMPRRDGIELIRQIKGDARLASMPVMIVSYRERDEDKLRGRDAGADYYLAKSNFHDDTLIAAVVDLIGPAIDKAAKGAT